MPELPEVETVVHSLRAAGLVGHTITGAHVLWKRSVATPSPAAFVRTVSGLQIGGVSRRGKFIVFALSKGWKLLIHLRMSGRIEVARDLRARAGAARRVPPKRLREGGRSAPTYTRLLLTLDDGRELRFKDTRKFGRVWLVEDAQGVLGRLGPEPLSLSVTGFWSLITDHSRLLKPLILDQSFLAGIGNIYVDEALWEARLHPLRKSDTLTRAEAECLLKAIKTVLRRGIRNLGTTLGKGHMNFVLPDGESGENAEDLRAYGRTGLPCLRCRTPIQRIIVGQRSTHVCPRCQRSEVRGQKSEVRGQRSDKRR